jgi:hypothetical protein
MLRLASLLAFFGAGFFLLTNAIYAIRNPAEFLKSRWTVRRGIRMETPPRQVRLFGLATLVVAAFWLLLGYMLLPQVIQLWRRSQILQYLISIAWWLGAIACLANGILAFLLPVYWMRSWGSSRMRVLDRPSVVRVIGAVMTALGVFWVVQGFQTLR